MVQPLRTRPLTKTASLITGMPSHPHLCPTPAPTDSQMSTAI